LEWRQTVCQFASGGAPNEHFAVIVGGSQPTGIGREHWAEDPGPGVDQPVQQAAGCHVVLAVGAIVAATGQQIALRRKYRTEHGRGSGLESQLAATPWTHPQSAVRTSRGRQAALVVHGQAMVGKRVFVASKQLGQRLQPNPPIVLRSGQQTAAVPGKHQRAHGALRIDVYPQEPQLPRFTRQFPKSDPTLVASRFQQPFVMAIQRPTGLPTLGISQTDQQIGSRGS
jgi:hypothetical protein